MKISRLYHWSKHLLFFAGFGLKFQGVERPFHSLGQVNGVPLKPPLGAKGPALHAPSKLAICRVHSMPSNVLRVAARCPQDPVGMQAVFPGAGSHWKRQAGARGKEGLAIRKEQERVTQAENLRQMPGCNSRCLERLGQASMGGGG